MGLDEIVSLLVNNGVGVICIAYFMFRDYKFMQKLTETLASVGATLDVITKITEDKERSIAQDDAGRNQTGISRLSR